MDYFQNFHIYERIIGSYRISVTSIDARLNTERWKKYYHSGKRALQSNVVCKFQLEMSYTEGMIITHFNDTSILNEFFLLKKEILLFSTK